MGERAMGAGEAAGCLAAASRRLCGLPACLPAFYTCACLRWVSLPPLLP